MGNQQSNVPRAFKVALIYMVEERTQGKISELRQQLQACGIEVFLFSKDMPVVESHEVEMHKQIKNADAVIICYSENFEKGRGYRHQEIKIALKEQNLRPPGNAYLIPIRLDNCEIPEYLGEPRVLNYFRRDHFKGILRWGLVVRRKQLLEEGQNIAAFTYDLPQQAYETEEAILLDGVSLEMDPSLTQNFSDNLLSFIQDRKRPQVEQASSPLPMKVLSPKDLPPVIQDIAIFAVYAPEDIKLWNEMEKHMTFLKRRGLITTWNSEHTLPEGGITPEAQIFLHAAQIVLFLMSADLLASAFDLIEQTMRRQRAGLVSVLPILFHPVDWKSSPFANLQVLPRNEEAVTEWKNREKAFFAIAQGIEQVAKEWLAPLIAPSRRSQSMANAAKLYPERSTETVQRDWAEAPDVPVFFGRTKELALLEQWITEDHCSLVAIVGMRGVGKTKLSVKLGKGGIGKTDLSLKLARGIEEQFDYVIWRRLLNAPKLSEIITDLIKFLSNQQEVHLPDTVDGQIARLLHYLRKSRCFIILDNVEMILQGGKQGSQYAPGYEDYGQLFEQIAEISHQSCVLLTSREKLPEVARFESKTGPVRSLEVRGLSTADGKKIFAEIGSFSGSKEDWKQLNSLYDGNPLALELAARHIKEVFFGSISAFLKEGKPIFANLRGLLDWHFYRLSDAHKEVMYWFAINREPTSLLELQEDILSLANKEQIASTLQSLQRLIPLEKSVQSFTLQPVLLEYMTQRFVEQLVEEMMTGEIALFNSHALLKTSVSDYVRDIQSRLILQSISEKLSDIYRGRERLEGRLKELLSLLQKRFRFISGYAGGNLLNFFRYSEIDVRGYNFSSLAVWQAYLKKAHLADVNFAYADLAKSAFTEAFSSVLNVAFSPQGGMLAAGTTVGEVRVWDAMSGLPLYTFRGHANWVHSVAFSPNGKVLVSGGDDRTIRLWEISSGQCLTTLQGHAQEVRSVTFSPDGKMLASCSDDQTVRLWEVSSGQCLSILQGHVSTIRSVAFSPDGKMLASGGIDLTVRLWEVSSGQCLSILQGHTQEVESVAFSPNGSILASGSADQTVRLWEVNSNQCLNTLQGHTSPVWSVAFSPDGKILASSGNDQMVRLWEISSSQCLNTLQGHTQEVKSVAFSPDGKTLASGSADQTVRLWKVSSGQCFNTLQGYTSAVWSVAFSPDGKTLASGGDDQMVRLWEVNSGQCLAILQGHSHWVNSVIFSPNGSILASGSHDQTVRLWEISSGQCLAILQGHSHWVKSVAFSPNGKILASGSADRMVRLWEVNSGQCLSTLQGHTQEIRSVAFSPDGKMLASGSHDQTVRLWEVNSGQCLSTLQGHIGIIYAVAFSPDGSTLASGGADQTVRLWGTNKDQDLNILQGHSRVVYSVAFSPDGSTLASSSADQTVRLWEVGRCLPPYVLRSERPYERMNITQANGLTKAQKVMLRSLGAIEE